MASVRAPRAATRVTTRTLRRGQDGSVVRRTVLPNGLRIVTEAVPAVRSVSFGLWVGVGSRDESQRQAGATHYLEHVLFKGTNRRSAMDISSAIDGRGGEINAFTAKEFTCYYARVLDTDLPVAVDVVVDMVLSSIIARADFEAERGVILEEIAMHDDDPADVVHEAFAGTVFGTSPLARPILGSTESIHSLTRDSVRRYYRRWYRPENIVVSAAGNLDHATVVRLVRRAIEQAGLDAQEAPPAPVRSEVPRGRPASGVTVLARPTEQVSVVLGVPGVTRTDDRRFALSVLNSALGGGMSSRLFQEVREKRGLAYSVYSYNTQYSDAGVFAVAAGCLPQKVDDVLELCRVELQRVCDQGITEDELRRGIGQVCGSLVLGMEETSSRMSRIGKSELVFGQLMDIDEILDRARAVTLDDIRAVAAEVLGAAPSLAVIGPFDDDRDFAAVVS